MRTLISMALGCTLGAVFGMALIHFGPRGSGLGLAVVGALVIGAGLANAVRPR